MCSLHFSTHISTFSHYINLSLHVTIKLLLYNRYKEHYLNILNGPHSTPTVSTSALKIVFPSFQNPRKSSFDLELFRAKLLTEVSRYTIKLNSGVLGCVECLWLGGLSSFGIYHIFWNHLTSVVMSEIHHSNTVI